MITRGETRADVLVYTSDALSEPLDVIGPVRLIAHAATSADDADFTAMLLDVHPNGFAQRLCDGLVRLRYRDGHDRASSVAPGAVYEVEVVMWDTCQRFLAGHGLSSGRVLRAPEIRAEPRHRRRPDDRDRRHDRAQQPAPRRRTSIAAGPDRRGGRAILTRDDVVTSKCRDDPGVVPRLIESSALARLLASRGIPTLHASAVEADGRGWVILGGSGNGKSTLAAWLCLDGAAALITDDALRVDLEGTQAYGHSGTTTVRLRDGARDLHQRFLAKAAQPEIDGRLLVHPAVAGRRVAVDVLLLPAPSRSATRVSLERLPRREALLAVLASPRTLGWEIAGPLRRHFELASFLSARLPAFRVRVPGGPPFKAAHVSSLREQLAAVLADHRSSDDARRVTC